MSRQVEATRRIVNHELPPNSPDVGQARVVIVGASGMVGGYALRYAIDHPAVGSVTPIGRKKLGTKHAELRSITVDYPIEFARDSPRQQSRDLLVLERE